MFAVVITEKGGAQQQVDFDKNEITVGRVQGNEVVLAKGNVSKKHARIVLKDGRFIVVDLKSTNGTYVNGRKITSPLVVKPNDKIYVGDFILTLEIIPEGRRRQPVLRPSGSVFTPHPMLDDEEDEENDDDKNSAADDDASSSASQRRLEHSGSTSIPNSSDDDEDPISASMRRPHFNRSGIGMSPFPTMSEPPNASPLAKVMARMMQSFNLESSDGPGVRASAERAIFAVIRELKEAGRLPLEEDSGALAKAALDEWLGLGPLDALIADENVNEILVQAHDEIWVDEGQGLVASEASFSSATTYLNIARRVSHQIHADPMSYGINRGQLPNGSEVTVIYAPIALRSAVLRIVRNTASSLDNLTSAGWMNASAQQCLQRMVQDKRNMAVIGAAKSGVTTLLGAIAAETPTDQRLVALGTAALHLPTNRSLTLSLPIDETLSFARMAQEAALLGAHRLVLDDVPATSLSSLMALVGGRAAGDLLGIHAPVPATSPFDGFRTLASAFFAGDAATLNTLLSTAIHTLICVAQTSSGHRVTHIVDLALESDQLRFVERYVADHTPQTP